MATVIMDPRASSDGTGSLASPWNTWSGKTFVAGNEYLQIAGTRYFGQLRCNQAGTAAARIRFGVYGDGMAVIDGSNGTARAVQIGANAHFVTLDGYEITGSNDPANPNFGVYWGFSATPANNGEILNCKIHDIAGNNASFDCDLIQAYGDDLLVSGCDLYNAPDDALWVQGARTRVRHNHIWNVGTDGSTSGDCIQFNGANNGYEIVGNRLDHSSTSEKQCFVITSAGSGAGGLFMGNELVMPYADSTTSAIYSDQPGDRIIGNRITGGHYGIQLVASGQVVNGNIIRNAARGCVVTSSGALACIVNNVFDQNTLYGVYLDTTGIVHNNIFLRNGVGLARKNTATCSHNAYWQNTSGSNFIGTEGSAEDNTVTADPLLDASYRLAETSPCRGAGLYVPGARHFGGPVMNPAYPDIGACRYFASRSVASRATFCRVTTPA